MNEISGHERKWPLEQPDGANAFLDSLANLGNSPLTWHLDERFTGAEISALVDDLEDAYYQAAAPWQPPRPVFGSTNNQDESKWLDESFLGTLQREATLRFWELVSTTRFCVTEPPDIRKLDFVHFGTGTITLTHVASLAAMVCIFNAINELESILKSWQQRTEPFLEGRSFDWQLENDAGLLEIILQATALDAPGVLAQYQAQTKKAREACDQANAWLVKLEDLQYQSGEHERKAQNKANFERATKSDQARKRASLPRKAPDLTPQIAADLWKLKPEKTKKEDYAAELGERYGLSERQFFRRLEKSKK